MQLGLHELLNAVFRMPFPILIVFHLNLQVETQMLVWEYGVAETGVLGMN